MKEDQLPQKPHFYKDKNGKTRKYCYCSLCTKGPFTEEQRDSEFFEFGYRKPIKYCRSCAYILNLISYEDVKKAKKPERENKKVEEIKGIKYINEKKEV